ncbi:MAG: hypothetical protein Q4C34_00495 [Bacteroidales bacterium]|nr:hypothetical protein [Bacteroidales bacterium]
MADNYLEKRMDDYARGRVSGPHARRTSGPRPGTAVIKYPLLTVALSDADSGDADAIVSMFVSAGCKVVFTAADATRGRDIAQSRGGRFYPGGADEAVTDMASRGEKADVVIACGTGGWPGCARRIRLTADTGAAAGPGETVVISATPARAALLCLALAHPDCDTSGQVITCR